MAHSGDNHLSEFCMLRYLSASIGADPMLVQGAGGNTSVKQAGVLWIKASGTWLKNARDDEIMVPVALAPLLDAVSHRSPAAEAAGQFTLADLNPRQLRPSIETFGVHSAVAAPMSARGRFVGVLVVARDD